MQLSTSELPFGGIRIPIEHGSVSFTAACFGKPYDWSFNPFQEPGDERKDPDLAERLGQALSAVGATTVYATRTMEFNAKVIDRHRLNKHIALPHGVDLIRNGEIPADGTTLFPGEASAMTAGGCPRIVVICGSRMADAHAGRDCLIDRKRLENGEPSRRHESVVEALIDMVRPPRIEDVHAWIFFSIEPSRFIHPANDVKYGEKYNRKLAHYLLKCWGNFGRSALGTDQSHNELDLPRLIQAQFAYLGVSPQRVHGLTTHPMRYDKRHAYGSPDLLYDTRGPEAKKRNLVTIVRHT